MCNDESLGVSGLIVNQKGKASTQNPKRKRGGALDADRIARGR